nr:VIT1/CCC1 transporter family protein [Paenibacillus sp. OV219]
MYELERERFEIVTYPEKERKEVADILPESAVSDTVDAISKDPDRWVDFMMKYELGFEKPEPKR